MNSSPGSPALANSLDLLFYLLVVLTNPQVQANIKSPASTVARHDIPGESHLLRARKSKDVRNPRFFSFSSLKGG